MSHRKILLVIALIAVNLVTALITKASIVTGQSQTNNTPSAAAIYGPRAICFNQSNVVYSVDAVPGSISYSWNVPSGVTIVSGQGTNSITVNFAAAFGDICVSVVDNNGISNPTCISTFYAATKPAIADTILGPVNTVCPGQIVTYSITNDSLASNYIWQLPSHMTVLSGANTNSIEVLVDTGFVWGYLRTSKSNCKGLSAQYAIAVYSAPAKPGSVTGPAVGACANGTYTYSIAPVPGATSYTWYTPQGCMVTSPATSGNPLTTSVASVDITFPSNFTYGTLYITSNSGCNSSEMREMKIRSLPMKPGAIHGPFYGVCEMTSVTYTVDSIAGATSYNWNFNSNLAVVNNNGSRSISVDFLPGFDHATLCVTADNSCGSSISRCGVVFAHPQVAQIIQGPTGACNTIPSVSIAYYSVDSVFGTTTYNWNVPPGATITAGQGTPRITVDYMGATSGNVSVSTTNGCGVSPARSLSIIVNPCRINNNNEVVYNDLINVYPNPATEEFTLSFSAVGNSDYKVRIMDITGREVMIRNHITSTGLNNEIFNVSEMQRGIYLAELSLNGNKQFVKVVVK